MKSAMILAAGRGERLRPLTDKHPKALCTLFNKPLLAHHLEHLIQSGFKRVIINHAYLGDQIRRFVNGHFHTRLEIIFSPEPPGALETGGGIVNALNSLGTEPFVTINADIYMDYDLRNLQLPNQRLAHVILVPKPSYRNIGDYGLSADGLLINSERNYIFSGITVYHPDFFKHALTGRYSVTPMIRKMAEQEHISGELHQGVWFDIGTPEQLKLAEAYTNQML
ncbi:MAG TPA: nucleotidyltransferase family protein [Legionellaceae bacterium]|nr:nucleotidyltransferase family protein [Legionellaceae bacterium]